MDFNDTQISEKELTELCAYYENQSTIARNLIRGSLDIRQKIKAKIVEDRERASSLLQILERLDEYEKIVRMQVEAAEKMEDPESLKKMQIIKKYESMVRTQREVWAKYEEEYEQLPMAKERRKVKSQLLKTSIQVKLLNYKIEEKKKMMNLKRQISNRREQLAIINFAKSIVEYKSREKHYYDLQSKVNVLKKREQELQFEVQQLEQLNINREIKTIFVEKQMCMQSLTLPSMDFSCYIISQKNNDRDYNCKDADTVSMFSLNLEQEYMNVDAEVGGKDIPKKVSKPTEMEESNSYNNGGSQETNTETLMDVNSEELLSEANQENIIPQSDKKDHSNIHNVESSKKNSQESKKSRQDTSKKRASQNQVSEEYLNCENIRDEQRNNRERNERPLPTPAKMSKHGQAHEGYSNCEKTRDDPSNMHNMSGRKPCSPLVAAKVQNWQRSSSPKAQKMNRDPLRQQQEEQQRQQQQSQHQYQQQKLQHPQQQRQCEQQRQPQQPQQERQPQHQQQQPRQPIQQPPSQQQQSQSKTVLHQQQQRQPLPQQPPLHQQQQRQPLPQQPPLHQQQQRQSQQQQVSWSPYLPQNTDGQNFNRDLTGLPQSNKPLIKSNEPVHYDTQRLFQKHRVPPQTMKQHAVSPMDISYEETLDAAPQMIQQSQSASNQTKPSVHVQLEQHVTPQYRSLHEDSMMSANIYSSDTNMSADNISAIIGSDITEPGGAAGLAHHLHGDSDNISEDVDIDFNIMSKFCSPLQQENSKLQQPPIHNGNKQNSVQFNEAAANHDSQEHTNRNFAMLHFKQTNQSNPSQRFF